MSRRVQVLFLVSLLGVLLCLGLLVLSAAGSWATGAYAVVVLTLLTVGSARARAAQAAAARSAGRTCTCCGTSQHDPVEVV